MDFKQMNKELEGGCESGLITDTGDANQTLGKQINTVTGVVGKRGKDITKKSQTQNIRRARKRSRGMSTASPSCGSVSTMSNYDSDDEDEDESASIAKAIDKQTASTNILAILGEKAFKVGGKRHTFLINKLAEQSGIELPVSSDEDEDM